MGSHKNNFDLLRILAALQVMVFHTCSHLQLDPGPVLGLLSAVPGVPIFFVISGYLVSTSLERSSSIRAYSRARFLRIYPALWVCLGVSILSAWLWGGVNFRTAQVVPWLLAQASIVQFYNPDFLRGYGVGVLNGSLWTIPVELQFYAVLPLLYWLLNRCTRKNLVLLGAICIFAIVQQIYADGSAERTMLVKVAGVTLLPYLYLFLLGVLLQRNPAWVARWLVGKAPTWVAVFIATAVLLHLLGLEIHGNTLNPISAIVLGLTVISVAYARPVSLRGYDLSYGVYIYHMVVVNAVVHAGDRTPSGAAVVVAGTLTLALLSWVLVERPALRLKRTDSSGAATVLIRAPLPSGGSDGV